MDHELANCDNQDYTIHSQSAYSSSSSLRSTSESLSSLLLLSSEGSSSLNSTLGATSSLFAEVRADLANGLLTGERQIRLAYSVRIVLLPCNLIDSSASTHSSIPATPPNTISECSYFGSRKFFSSTLLSPRSLVPILRS